MTVSLDRVGGRKFLLAMSTLACTAWLTMAGYISDGVYSAVVIATCGAYIAGNVVQHKAGAQPPPAS